MRKITCWHRIISDKCREKGDVNLLVPLGRELQVRLFDALNGHEVGIGTKFNLKLEIELEEK